MLLTVKQAASAANVSAKTILRLIAAGRLVAQNYGTAQRANWRIDPAALVNLKPTESEPTIKRSAASIAQRRRRNPPPPPIGRVLIW